jgi:hypothetical protein
MKDPKRRGGGGGGGVVWWWWWWWWWCTAIWKREHMKAAILDYRCTQHGFVTSSKVNNFFNIFISFFISNFLNNGFWKKTATNTFKMLWWLLHISTIECERDCITCSRQRPASLPNSLKQFEFIRTTIILMSKTKICVAHCYRWSGNNVSFLNPMDISI